MSLERHQLGNLECPECYETAVCRCGGVLHGWGIGDIGNTNWWIIHMICDQCGVKATIWEGHEEPEYES